MSPALDARQRFAIVASLFAVLASLAFTVAAAKSVAADDFDWRARVQIQGASGLHAVVLPAQAYQFSRNPQLADLRLFNGAGEAIPFAVDRIEIAAASPPTRPAKAVPLRLSDPASALAELPAVALRYEGQRLSLSIEGQAAVPNPANPRTVAWYIDLAGAATSTPAPTVRPYRALTLRLGGNQDFQTTVTLEGSDDLRHWQMLAPHAALLRVGRDAQMIRHDRIEFPPTRLRYLRLSWPAALAAVDLDAAEVEGEPQASAPPWQTLRLTGKPRTEGDATVVTYESPAPVPASRLQLILPQINTIAPVRIESRRRESDPWKSRLDATFYRLASSPAGAPDASSGPQPLSTGPIDDRHWQVKFDRRAGGFGAQPPQLELAWPARRVVFAARGEPPFTLAIGRPRLNGASLPIDTIVPGYRPDQPLAAAPATLEAAQIRSTDRSWLDDLDPTQAAMWAALVATVAVLGGLAWRLLRSPGAP